jgi:hypothetical protein
VTVEMPDDKETVTPLSGVPDTLMDGAEDVLGVEAAADNASVADRAKLRMLRVVFDAVCPYTPITGNTTECEKRTSA